MSDANNTIKNTVKVRERGKADDVLEAHLRALISASPDHDVDVVVPALVKELGGFANSTSATFTLKYYFVYVLSELVAGDIHRKYEGRLGGLGLPGGGKVWGTLYYDNISDLKGGCDININAAVVAINVNFIHSGKTFATFIGGGVGTVSGIFGGNGEWDST